MRNAESQGFALYSQEHGFEFKIMSKSKFLVLAFLAVVGLSLGAIWIFKFAMGDKPYSTPWESKRPKAEIESACRKHVGESDTKANQALGSRSAEFSEFIRSRKPGAQGFSKDIVSWYGKWRAVKPYLPRTDSDGHKAFVAEKFSQHIFTSEDLASAVRRAIEGSIKDLESIENDLAVALRQEILGRSLSPDEVPIAAEQFKKAVEQMVAASQWDAAKSAGSLVASELAAQVATQVLLRLGVSAGILATATANSWWTFGAALVIGILVDVVWEWFDDPAADIEREVASSLEKLSLDASTAINEEMKKVISQRTELWNKTITEILP